MSYESLSLSLLTLSKLWLAEALNEALTLLIFWLFEFGILALSYHFYLLVGVGVGVGVDEILIVF